MGIANKIAHSSSTYRECFIKAMEHYGWEREYHTNCYVKIDYIPEKVEYNYIEQSVPEFTIDDYIPATFRVETKVTEAHAEKRSIACEIIPRYSFYGDPNKPMFDKEIVELADDAWNKVCQGIRDFEAIQYWQEKFFK